MQFLACADLLLSNGSSATKRLSVWALILCLVLDSLIMHEPFTQTYSDQEKEAVHFGCNFALIGALLMRSGFRDLS